MMSNLPYTRLSSDEYLDTDGWKTGTLSVSFVRLQQTLGEPHYNADDDFPDDCVQVDVCWGLRSTTSPDQIAKIWNYQDGPVFTGRGTVEEITEWSVYYTDEVFWRQIQNVTSTDSGKDREGFLALIDKALADLQLFVDTEVCYQANGLIDLLQIVRDHIKQKGS